MGTRVEKGEIIEVPEEALIAFGPGYFEPCDKPLPAAKNAKPAETEPVAPTDATEPAKPAETPEEQRKALEAMKVDQLRELATELGLDAEGNKSDVIDRILLAKQTQ